MSINLRKDQDCKEAFNASRINRFNVHRHDVVCEPDIFRAGYAAGMAREQTANLCTTDACESLRARLAKYEDAEGRPVVDAQRLLDWNRSQPEPRPIVVGREYQVAEACARLNSSPVTDGGVDERAAFDALESDCREMFHWVRGCGAYENGVKEIVRRAKARVAPSAASQEQGE
jgi:hypothetical protein